MRKTTLKKTGLLILSFFFSSALLMAALRNSCRCRKSSLPTAKEDSDRIQWYLTESSACLGRLRTRIVQEVWPRCSTDLY